METLYLKPTIKSHNLHYKYSSLSSAVGSAEQSEVIRKHHIQNRQSNPLSLTMNVESLQPKFKYHSSASSKKYDASSKKHDDILECTNENRCVILLILSRVLFTLDIIYIA